MHTAWLAVLYTCAVTGAVVLTGCAWLLALLACDVLKPRRPRERERERRARFDAELEDILRGGAR